jgi:hypothetical protein
MVIVPLPEASVFTGGTCSLPVSLTLIASSVPPDVAEQPKETSSVMTKIMPNDREIVTNIESFSSRNSLC